LASAINCHRREVRLLTRKVDDDEPHTAYAPVGGSRKTAAIANRSAEGFLQEGSVRGLHPLQPLAIAAIFVAGTGAGLALAPSPGRTADVAEIASLTARVEQLAQLVAQNGGGPASATGTVLKAPFTVVDQGNQVIFSVQSTGAGGIVRVKTGSGASVDLGNTSKGWGVLVGNAGGLPLAELTQGGSLGMALRIYSQSGKHAAQVGAAPNGLGALRLFGDGDKTAVRMDSNADGSGFLRVSGKQGEESGFALDTSQEVLKFNGAKGDFYLGQTAEDGFGLKLEDPNDTIAVLSKPPGKGTSLRMYDAGQDSAQIGGIPGQGGQIRLYSDTGDVAVTGGAIEGVGVMQVWGAGIPAAGMTAKDSSVNVYNSGGQPVALLTLSRSGTGGKVVANNNGGVPIFQGGVAPDGTGDACVASKNGAKCIGKGLPLSMF
jgi:hypothetical protein